MKDPTDVESAVVVSGVALPALHAVVLADQNWLGLVASLRVPELAADAPHIPAGAIVCLLGVDRIHGVAPAAGRFEAAPFRTNPCRREVCLQKIEFSVEATLHAPPWFAAAAAMCLKAVQPVAPLGLRICVALSKTVAPFFGCDIAADRPVAELSGIVTDTMKSRPGVWLVYLEGTGFQMAKGALHELKMMLLQLARKA